MLTTEDTSAIRSCNVRYSAFIDEKDELRLVKRFEMRGCLPSKWMPCTQDDMVTVVTWMSGCYSEQKQLVHFKTTAEIVDG